MALHLPIIAESPHVPLLFVPSQRFDQSMQAQLQSLAAALQAVAGSERDRASLRREFLPVVRELISAGKLLPDQVRLVGFLEGAQFLEAPDLRLIATKILWMNDVEGHAPLDLPARAALFRSRFGDAFADRHLALFDDDRLSIHAIRSSATDKAFDHFFNTSQSQSIPLTCVRIDVESFTRKTSGKMSSSEQDRLINQFFTVFTECANQYGLFFNKSMGDGFQFIAYGDDHAFRAVNAALAMRDWSRKFNRDRAEQGETSFTIRIGLASGRGSPSPKKVGKEVRYLEVQGDLMVDASRVEPKAPSDGVLIAQSTLDLCGDRFAIKGTQRITGKEGRQEVDIVAHEISHLRPIIKDFLADSQLQTPLIDRVDELAKIRDQFERSYESSQAGMVLVAGPAGIGKSRLLSEFCRGLTDFREGLQVITGQGLNLPASVANRDFVALLMAHFELYQLDPQAAYQKIKRDMATCFVAIPQERQQELIQLMALFLGIPLLDGEISEKVASLLQPNRSEQLRIASFEAVKEYFDALLQVKPVVLVLDDLQWFDKGSLSLLSELRRYFARKRFFVAGTVRREDKKRNGHGKGQQKGQDQSSSGDDDQELKELLKKALGGIVQDQDACVSLQPLVAQDGEDLLNTLWPLSGTERSDEQQHLRTKILSESAGNPLQITELVHAVRDFGWHLNHQGKIVSKDGKRVWTGLESFSDVRLQQLSVSSQASYDTIRIAAVIDGEFTQGELERLRAPVTDEVMTNLIESGLIVPVDLGGLGRYRFTSDQLRETAYKHLGEQDQKRHHRNYLEILRTSHRTNLASEAYHLEKSGEIIEASDKYYQAAEEAFHKKGVIEVADGLYERAYALASQANDRGRQWRILRGWDEALFLGARFVDQKKVYDHAMSIAGGMTAVDRAAAMFRFGRALNRLGEYSETHQLLSEAYSLVISIDEFKDAIPVLGNIMQELGYNHACAGRYSESLSYYNKAEIIAEKTGNTLLLGRIYVCRNVTASKIGDFSFGLRSIRKAVEIFGARGDERRALAYRSGVGSKLIHLGRYQEAEEELKTAAEIAEREFDGKGQNIQIIFSKLGTALFLGGKVDEAIQVLLKHSQISSSPALLISHLAYLTACYLDRGFLEKAREVIKEMRCHLHEEDRESRAVISMFDAQLALREEALDQARELIAEAVLIYDELKGQIEDFGLEILHTDTRIKLASGNVKGAEITNVSAVKELMRSAALLDKEDQHRFLHSVPLHQQILNWQRRFGNGLRRNLTELEFKFLDTMTEKLKVPSVLPPELRFIDVNSREVIQESSIVVGQFTQVAGTVINLHPIEAVRRLFVTECVADWIPADFGSIGVQVNSMRVRFNEKGEVCSDIHLTIVPELVPDKKGLLGRMENRIQMEVLKNAWTFGDQHQHLEVHLVGTAAVNEQGIISFTMAPAEEKSIFRKSERAENGLLGRDLFGWVKVSISLLQDDRSLLSLATQHRTYTGAKGIGAQLEMIQTAIVNAKRTSRKKRMAA